MSIPAVKKGLEILASGMNVDALRRLIVMTIAGSYLSPASTNEVPSKDGSLSELLSRLPTKALGAVASISKGKTGIKDAPPGPFPLVVTAEARSMADHFDFEGPGVMIPLVSSTGHGDASLKRIHFQDGQYAVGSILAVVQPNDSSVLSARYLHAYLSAFKDELLVSRMVGTANVSLTVAKISDVPVPLLPIQGQHKIDELMSLCDRLEAEQADAESAHAKLVDTLLGTLTQSTNAADPAANSQRLTEHFDTLFTTESSLDALKQTILQLAIMGKLVPQDPNDEPASELLKKIAAEKARLVKVGKIKNEKPLPPIGKNEKTFELPEGWEWVQLGALVDFKTGKLDSNAGVEKGKYPFFTCAKEPLAIDEYAFDCEAVLLAGNNASGNFNVKHYKGKFNAYQRTYVITTEFGDRQALSYHYLKYVLVYLLQMFQEKSIGTLTKYLTLGLLKPIAIALPPLAEQHRIVVKVDELMTLCDRLKTDLAESRRRQERLASTLIESALNAA